MLNQAQSFNPRSHESLHGQYSCKQELVGGEKQDPSFYINLEHKRLTHSLSPFHPFPRVRVEENLIQNPYVNMLGQIHGDVNCCNFLGFVWLAEKNNRCKAVYSVWKFVPFINICGIDEKYCSNLKTILTQCSKSRGTQTPFTLFLYPLTSLGPNLNFLARRGKKCVNCTRPAISFGLQKSLICTSAFIWGGKCLFKLWDQSSN